MRRLSAFVVTCTMLALFASPALAQPPVGATHYDGWYTFNGNLEEQKYSEADQITPQNVGQLEKVWEVHTGDVSDGSGKIPLTDWSATPLFVNNTVYVSTPFYRIFAVEPDTGKVKWIYDTHAVLQALTQPHLKTRGVAYWGGGAAVRPPCQKIVYIGTMDAKLHAVDADTGKTCEGFADGGVLNVDQWNTINHKWPLSMLQPPAVYKDTLIIGWAGMDWAEAEAPPGTVFAIDARTGKLKWTFDALPPQIGRNKTGTANVWAGMSVDPEKTSSFCRSLRRARIIMAATARRHAAGDLGDGGQCRYRQGAVEPPARASRHLGLRHQFRADAGRHPQGRPDHSGAGAVQQDGILLRAQPPDRRADLSDRGKPVPPSDVPGEQSSPTQPYAPTPEPTVPDRFPGISNSPTSPASANAAASSSAFATTDVTRRRVCAARSPIRRPPAAWNGAAARSTRQRDLCRQQLLRGADLQTARTQGLRGARRRHGAKDGYYPQTGAPYGFYLHNFLNLRGMPCWDPPYGTLSSYDLNTGKLLWRKPFGQVQQWGFYMPESWGSVTIGAPLITKSGLDLHRRLDGRRVRAIDLKSGETCCGRRRWMRPPSPIPAVYTYKGKQYVVFVAGGNAILTPQASDQVVAFALK